MKTIKAFIKRHPVLSFYALAFAITWGGILIVVGGIAKRPVVVEGRLEEREHLCLTVSFDHDIVDGAPAARFTSRCLELLASGDALRDAVAHGEQLAKA
jgi:2-oxoacid dehydrogenases acyltransferase (catalytic domain)